MRGGVVPNSGAFSVYQCVRKRGGVHNDYMVSNPRASHIVDIQ